jgi:hypothetical protein
MIIENTVGTILGGLLLTFIYFVFNEILFPKKNLTGEWLATLKYIKTTYNPYKGLKVIYKLHLLQKGNDIIGTGEKIKEIRSDGSEYEFEFDKRVTISMEGYYERRFLSKSKINFNVTEDGRIRESRATYFLKIENKNLLIGKFLSTAANTKGDIEIIRELD